MNLLLIVNSYPNLNDSFVGGIFVKEQVNELKKDFNHIYVISPTAFGMSFLRKQDLVDYTYDNVSIFFPKYFNIPLFWFMGRYIWVYLERKAVESLITNNKIIFHLVHAHFTWPSGSVGARIKEKYIVPLIITEHSSNTFKKAIDVRDGVFIDPWRMADKIIRIRYGDINEFSRVGISTNKVVGIPNGFNGRSFKRDDPVDCRNKVNLPIDKKIILNIGNMYGKVKGHEYLVEAIAKVVKVRDDVLVVLVGDGKLRDGIEKKISQLKLDKYFLLVGKKQHNDMPMWINASDIFVLPSLNEGNPTVMFETLGCGKPFIGTKVGGVPEVITSDEWGLLVEPANPDDLAEKILMALDRQWDEKKILEHAAQFTWENIAKQIMGVYEEVLKRDLK